MGRRGRGFAAAAAVLAVSVLLVATTAAGAAPGDRDVAFGLDGVVSLGQGSSSLLAVPGGRVVAFGTEPDGTVVARRITATGGVDPTFGVAGRAVLGPGNLSYAGSSFTEFRAHGDLDPSGRIVVVDVVDGIVRRLTADGLADPTWPPGGVPVAHAFDLDVDAAGRTVLAIGTGSLEPPAGVVRLTAAGALDPAFGSGGKVVLPAGGFPVRVAVDSADRIVVGEQVGSECGPRFVCSAALLRLTTSGAVDGTFHPPAVSFVRDLVVAPDGTILVTSDGPIVRLAADGTRITTGRTPSEGINRSSDPVPMAVGGDGTVFVGDNVHGGTAALRPDLTVDASFGHCGYALGRGDRYVVDVAVVGSRLVVSHVSTIEAFRLDTGGPAVPYAAGHVVIAVGADGGLLSRGPACVTSGLAVLPHLPVVGAVSTPTFKGLWMVASDGGIFSFGDAGFYGSTGALRLNKPVVGMAATPSGRGYWLVASDGGIFSFGDAPFLGSAGALPLVAPITGMAATHTGGGYWLVARDGGIFTYGDAPFRGRVENDPQSAPHPLGAVVAIAADPAGTGYAALEAQTGPHFEDPSVSTPRAAIHTFGVADPSLAGPFYERPLQGVGLMLA